LTNSKSTEDLKVKVEVELPEDRVSKEEVRLVGVYLLELVRIALHETWQDVIQ
jgi:hypothetical protein